MIPSIRIGRYFKRIYYVECYGRNLKNEIYLKEWYKLKKSLIPTMSGLNHVYAVGTAVKRPFWGFSSLGCTM